MITNSGVRTVVGLASTGHGASIACVRDGTVRASVLDRWIREKHTLLLARDEAEAILARATPIDCAIHDILEYSFGRFPPFRVFEEVIDPWLAWFLGPIGIGPEDVDLVVTSDSHFATGAGRLGPHLKRWFPNARIVIDVEHHAIHQAQAFWASGFEEAAVLTLDTCGERLERLGGRKLAGTISRMGRDGRREVLREMLFPESSSGLVYAVVTRHLGFPQGEEGKTMGLAPYGEMGLARELLAELRLDGHGGFRFIGHEALRERLGRFVPPLELGRRVTHQAAHAEVARAGQEVIDEIVAAAFKAAIELTGTRTLAYAGGVALNSVANEKAIRAAGVERFYATPNPGDPGHALGCALHGAFALAGLTPVRGELPDYLGPDYAHAEIAAAASGSGFEVADANGAEPLVARCLANGHVVARFAGRAEFGPRALGNRSILCDPRRPDAKDHLNSRVKFREPFRPYAPSALADLASDWFDVRGPSPYMLRVVPVHPDRRAAVPGIVHVDGSARLQTVTRDDNSDYWRLIAAFYELTGVPMVLNTSFNVAGEPIVETPADAVSCFRRTAIDVLILGDRLVSERPLAWFVENCR